MPAFSIVLDGFRGKRRKIGDPRKAWRERMYQSWPG
jgi:hypothetical protein